MTTVWERHAAAICRRGNSVKVQYGVEVAYGPLDRKSTPGLNASGEPIQYLETALLLPADAFSVAVPRHATLTVDGTAYKVRDVRSLDDGLVLEYVLAEVPS